jgi:hypothetical protein
MLLFEAALLGAATWSIEVYPARAAWLCALAIGLQNGTTSFVTGAVLRTSHLTGMFTDLLTGDAPMILFGRRLVLFWSSADQVLDFTTKDDVARVTALAALDDDAPRVIEMAGDQVTARDVARTMSELTGERFRLQWAGTTGPLSAMSAVGRRLSKDPDETFPAWQGMQYFVSMFSGQAQLHHVNNDRYGVQSWTSVRDVLRAHLSAQGHPATD